MKRTLYFCTAVIPLLCPRPSGGQTQKPRLLPTGGAAAKIRSIQNELVTGFNKETVPFSKAQHERQFEQLKRIVTGFVIRQLEAEPAIERWQLRDQLIRIFGGQRDEQNPDAFLGPPYVFRAQAPNQDSPSVWAVAYRGDAYDGLGGSRTVVESYAVESGKARLAGRGGMEMDGYELSAEQIGNPGANSTSILIHGILDWASGHVLPSAAELYSVSPAGVKAIWKLTAPGIQFLGRDGMLFVIEYHDEQRHSKNLPSTAVDAYAIGRDSEIPYRVIHQFPVF
jgi:hypothetical protein